MPKVMHHSDYQESLKDRPIEQIRYIRNDAYNALQAMPEGENASYYADEVCYCSDEIHSRMGV